MTGSGTVRSAALERDAMSRDNGVEVSPALLKIEGLSKTFGGTRALIDAGPALTYFGSLFPFALNASPNGVSGPPP